MNRLRIWRDWPAGRTAGTEQERQNWADVLRGFGILAIYTGHFLLGDYGRTGLGIRIISTCNLPLFYFVSGYFTKPGRDIKTCLRRNCTGLLLPYLIASLFWWLADCGKAALAGTFGAGLWNTFLGIFLQLPDTPWEGGRWFLPSFFLAKTLFELVLPHIANRSRRILAWAVVPAGLAWCYTLFGGPRLPWNPEAALLVQPFFIMGYVWKHGLERRISQLDRRGSLCLWAVTLAAYGAALWLNGTIGGENLDFHQRDLHEFFSAYIACGGALLMLVLLAKRLRGLWLLTFIGRNSIVYFLYGGLAGAVVSRVLRLLDWQAPWIRLLAGLAGLSLLMIPVAVLLRRYFPAAVGRKNG